MSKGMGMVAPNDHEAVLEGNVIHDDGKEAFCLVFQHAMHFTSHTK